MKFKIYLSLVATLVFMACKNDAKPDGNATAKPVTESPHANSKAPAGAVQEKDKKVLLRLRLTKGFRQQVTYSRLAKIKGVMYDNATMFIEFKVDSVMGGAPPVYGLTFEVKSVKAEVDGVDDNLGKASYNSLIQVDKNDVLGNELEAHYRPIISKKIYFALNNRGKRVDKAIESVGGMGLYDFHSIHFGFPEKPVGVGDSWTTISSAMGDLGMAKNTFTVKKITKRAVFIDYVMELTAPKTGNIDNLLGHYVVDRETGAVKLGSVKGVVNQYDMALVIDISFTGQVAEGWQVVWEAIKQ